MEWINEYLSRKYESGARGPEAYDCWGLVREARHRYMGKRLLPEWGAACNTNPKEITRAYRAESPAMEQCRPEAGAIAAVMRGPLCVHVALVVYAGGRLKVLETNPGRGARCRPISQFESDHNVVLYYRDRE